MRSEGVVAVLLQKAKAAKRIYASVLNAGSNADGYKDEGITFPSQEMQISLFQQVQNEVGVNATHVSFMEAHGSATKVCGFFIHSVKTVLCNLAAKHFSSLGASFTLFNALPQHFSPKKSIKQTVKYIHDYLNARSNLSNPNCTNLKFILSFAPTNHAGIKRKNSNK